MSEGAVGTESQEGTAAPLGAPAGESAGTESQQGLPGTAQWLENVSETYRGDPALRGIPDVNALAKSYIETKSFVGRKGVILPKEDDPADLNRFYNELGRPEDETGYDFEGFEAPEDFPFDETLLDRMRSSFHKRGLTPQQARGLAEDLVSLQAGDFKNSLQTIEQRRVEHMQALEKQYGKAWPATKDLATRAFSKLAGDKAEELANRRFIDGGRVGDDPLFFEVFANAGKGLQEHELLGSGASAGIGMTPEAAERERAKLRSDPEFMRLYLGERDSEGNPPDPMLQREAVERYSRLTEYATPDEPQEEIIYVDE